MFNYKKYIIKNILIITFIMLIAIVSTHYIYFKFKDVEEVDYNSKSLDIVFHEKSGANITLDKATPVTDSVGLTSKSYTFTVTNNLTEPVKYEIKVLDAIKEIEEDECGEYKLNPDYIRISIKSNKGSNDIYTLSELEDNTLLETKIKPLEQRDYTVRVWVDKNTTQPSGASLHYHGLIKVVEE